MWWRKKRINILWDSMFQTDEQLLVDHPDIMVVDQEQRSSHVIDLAFPDESNIREKERKKDRGVPGTEGESGTDVFPRVKGT